MNNINHKKIKIQMKKIQYQIIKQVYKHLIHMVLIKIILIY